LSIQNNDTYEKAARLVQEGDKGSARRVLAQILHANPDDLAAWLLLSECVENDEQLRDCAEQIEQLSGRPWSAGIAGNNLDDEIELIGKGKNEGKPNHRFRRRLVWFSLILLVICGGAAGALFLSKGLPTWASEILADTTISVPELSDSTLAQTVGEARRDEMEIQAVEPVIQEAAAENFQVHLPSMVKSPPVEEEPAVEISEPPANPDGRGNPKKWKNWPVTPYISQHAVEVYLRGIENGNDAHAFSLLGDCHSEPYIMFERFANDSYLEDPNYKEYKKTLKYFHNSWNRYFVTMENGMTVASAFSPAWATHTTCKSGENPLECEFRNHNPGILLISLGTNWGGRNPADFEKYLRRIVEFSLERAVLPVIATKGDPAGPHNPLNEIMVQVAYEYDIPLWNFWAAIQDLPNNGLNPWDGLGGVHLAPDSWAVKRNTGLMALDAIRRVVGGE
jgi:hypothetical protein